MIPDFQFEAYFDDYPDKMVTQLFLAGELASLNLHIIPCFVLVHEHICECTHTQTSPILRYRMRLQLRCVQTISSLRPAALYGPELHFKHFLTHIT